MKTWRYLAGWAPAAVLAVAAIWVVMPMYRVTWWASHEHIWYPVRVHEYLQAWRGGSWYPRWRPDLYGGYGYPFLDYYAPGVYAGASVLAKLFAIGPIAALKLLIVLVTMASAVGAYGLVRGESSRLDAALLGAAIYVFLPYRCTDLFTRGDLAEYCAYALVPFVGWAYRAASRQPARRAVVAACLAALLHAAVLMTHTLIGMFTTEIVGIYVLVLLARRRRDDALLAAGAVAFAVAIAAVYVLPAFLEQHYVFLERITNDRYTPWQNAVALCALCDPFFTPGWALIAGFAVWLGSFALRRARAGAVAAAVPWIIAGAMIVLMLPGVVVVWKVLPFGAKAQFPWRLLGFAGLFGALGIAIWWARTLPPGRLALALAIALSLPLPALLSAQRHVVPSAPIPLTSAAIQRVFGSSTVMDEYLPRHVRVAPTGPRTILARADHDAVAVDVRQLDPLHYEVAFDAPAGKTLISLAVFGFPGWHVTTIQGPEPATIAYGARDGLLRIVVKRPGHYDVRVAFGQTPLRAIAAVTSLLALCALYPCLLLLSRRRRTRAG